MSYDFYLELPVKESAEMAAKRQPWATVTREQMAAAAEYAEKATAQKPWPDGWKDADNGWGRVIDGPNGRGAVSVLRSLAAAWSANPDAVLLVSR